MVHVYSEKYIIFVIARVSKNMDFKRLFYSMITFFLFVVFIYFAFESWDKYNQRRISTNVQEKKSKNFLYPSITVCPEKTFKTHINLGTVAKTFSNVKNFYLKNVRTMKEVFFFVNQRSWGRDGHKCLTGAISEDPGRPCVFPFTWRNKTLDKCSIPTT